MEAALPPTPAERILQKQQNTTCEDVENFISSLNANSTVNDLDAICTLIRVFNFDTCDNAEKIRQDVFDYFMMLLPRFHSVSTEIAFIYRKMKYLSIKIEEINKQSMLLNRGELMKNLKPEFFSFYGGATVENKNIFDLIMHKSKEKQERHSWVSGRAMGHFLRGGKRQPNRKKASRLRRSSKKHSLRKNKSRRNKNKSRRNKSFKN